MGEQTVSTGQSGGDCVAPHEEAQSAGAVPLGRRRLDRLARQVAALFRKAHVTAVEARYVHKRARALAGIRGRPQATRRLPEILSPEELQRILGQAYREKGLYGLIVRTLFETGLRVSELIGVQAADVDFTERTIRVRQGKGGKDRVVLFTPDLGQQVRLHLDGRTRGALFESNRARPSSVRMIQHIVKAIAHKAGVEKKISPTPTGTLSQPS